MANTLKFGNGEWYGKKDTILAYNDENSNYKPLPFNFSRASKATRVNKDGLIEEVGSGQPRVDYLNNTKGAMLLEPSRSNITYPSENFSNQLQGASATFGTLISPDGTLNGSTIASTADGVYKGWHRTYNLTDDTYTFSMFVKYYNSQWISIYRIGQVISRFDVKNGVFGSNPSNLKSVNYGNGWYRLEFTFTAASGTNWLYIYPSSDIGETSSTGDGLYIWGGQLEVGSYATSYIPTSGSAVTRVAETCNQGGISHAINSTEGVLYAETSNVAKGDISIISLTDGTNNERVMIYFNSDLTLYFYIRVNSSYVATFVVPANQINFEATNKIAIKYKTNDMSFWLNGTKVGTDTSGTMFSPNTLSQLGFNSGTGSTFYGEARDVKIYDTALTDQELQALTQV